MTVSVPIDPPPTYRLPAARHDRGLHGRTRADGRGGHDPPQRLLLFGLGLLLAGFAVGRRGRWLAVIGGLAGAIGFANLSGAVLSDWFDAAAGRTVGVDAAVRISETAALPWSRRGGSSP